MTSASRAKSALSTTDRLGTRHDEFYVALIEAHVGLSPEQSRDLNARLLLLLANEVGDVDVLKTAILRASRGLGD